MSGTCTVYLLHFHEPGPGGASHYLGFSDDLEKRLEAHRRGRGAKLLRAIARAGIGFSLVRLWLPGDRARERQLKKRHQHARLCPVCRPAALARHAERERARRRRTAPDASGAAA